MTTDIAQLLDIHTHRMPPYAEGVISLRAGAEPCRRLVEQWPDQAFSVGLHPWDIEKVDVEEALDEVALLADKPNVIAIGEAGVDTLKGGPLFRQLNAFRRQIDISEQVRKPLVIHDVKAHDIIVGLRRDLRPQQRWIIHGFAGKPGVAEMLLRSGCDLSFGRHFNPESLRLTPPNRRFSETDSATIDIHDILSLHSTGSIS